VQEAIEVAQQQVKAPHAQDNEKGKGYILANQVGAGDYRIPSLHKDVPHPLSQRSPLHICGRGHRLHLDVDRVLQDLARLLPFRINSSAHGGQLGLQIGTLGFFLIHGTPRSLTAYLTRGFQRNIR